MAVKKFVVSAAHEPSKSVSFAALVIGPLIAAVGLVASGSSLSQWAIVAAITFVLLLNRQGGNACQATVTVYPTGVQLAKSHQNQQTPPLFLPRDQILDVICSEVILAHKVVSVVLFRVLKGDTCTNDPFNNKPSIASLLKEGRIHLVPAFDGVEMSFEECQKVRRKLSAFLQ
jgi:hypothetical protein